MEIERHQQELFIGSYWRKNSRKTSKRRRKKSHVTASQPPRHISLVEIMMMMMTDQCGGKTKIIINSSNQSVNQKLEWSVQPVFVTVRT